MANLDFVEQPRARGAGALKLTDIEVAITGKFFAWQASRARNWTGLLQPFRRPRGVVCGQTDPTHRRGSLRTISCQPWLPIRSGRTGASTLVICGGLMTNLDIQIGFLSLLCERRVGAFGLDLISTLAENWMVLRRSTTDGPVITP